jgi:amidophosphoribosyltransferase
MPNESIAYIGIEQLANPEKRLQEKCGIFGVHDPDNNANLYLPVGQLVLQDRGRDSAGGAILNRDGEIRSFSEMGTVAQVFSKEVVERVLGSAEKAIGHTRYATDGPITPLNKQPVEVRSTISNVSIALAENGNHYENPSGRDFSFLPRDANDTVKLTHHLLLLTEEHPELEIPQIFQLAFSEMSEKGAGAEIALVTGRQGESYMIGTRDTRKTRPLVLGRLLNGGWIMASESAAIEKVGGEYIREVEGGEIVVIDGQGNINSYFCGEPRQEQQCAMEAIYFERPDSLFMNKRVLVGRMESGRALGERMKSKGIHPTRIVPVPDSGLPAGNGVAQAYGLPLTQGIITEHHIGRTFTMSKQRARLKTQDLKHGYLPDQIAGEMIANVDDSLVRSNTSRKNIDGLRRKGRAYEVHQAVASPAFVEGCDRGINTKTEELPAAKWRHLPYSDIERKMARHINADSMTFLPIEDLAASFDTTTEHLCYTCMGGPHPIKDGQPELPQSEKALDGKPKISVFISGQGTNLQEIINGVESGDIDAEITSVVSNNINAFGLERAARHHINTATVPSKGNLSNTESRRQFEQMLLHTIDLNPANIIVLSGWMVVLSDEFLTEIQKRKIAVINLHPALLTAYNANKIKTSRGEIPVIRGAHAIQDAWDQNLPVSGVTVHQVLPGQGVDVGPILLKEEVRRREEDTFESFEQRIHQAEYRSLPTALKRALHALKNNIDISTASPLW